MGIQKSYPPKRPLRKKVVVYSEKSRTINDSLFTKFCKTIKSFFKVG